MGTPKGNGLVEIIGESQGKERGFFCMKLVSYLNEEAKPGTEQYATILIIWLDVGLFFDCYICNIQILNDFIAITVKYFRNITCI